MVILVNLGSKLTGHPSILHGGITALLLDNAFGWAVYLLSEDPISYHFFTAHLGIDYRNPAVIKPTDINRYFQIECHISSVEGRKVSGQK